MLTHKINAKAGRITRLDQRWYPIEYQAKNSKGEIETIKTDYRSVNTYLETVPKGVGWDLFLKSYGKNADAMFREAGELGDAVHHAVNQLLNNNEIIQGRLVGFEDEEERMPLIQEAYSLEQWDRILAWCKWFIDVNPEVLYSEEIVFSHKYQYAGTVDFIGKRGDTIFIADWKTGENIYEKYYYQLAAYTFAVMEMDPSLKIEYGSIVHINPRKYWGNKYKEILVKFSDLEKHFKRFLFYREDYLAGGETGKSRVNEKPKYLTYPLKLSLEMLKSNNGPLVKEYDKEPDENEM